MSEQTNEQALEATLVADTPALLEDVAPPTVRERPPALVRFWRYLRRTPKFAVGLSLLVAISLFAIIAPIFSQDPTYYRNPSYGPPSAEHWLGTTKIGNDVFAQLAHGSLGSLTIGVFVALIAVALSIFFGVVSGYMGGWVDEFLSLFTNIMLVIPGIPLVIVLAAYVPGRNLWVIILVLSVTSWAGSAIVLRSQARSLRNRDYVAAARVAGERPFRIITVEILPNLLPLAAAQFLFAMIFAILGEAGLSFLGLGPSGSITWGTILNQAQSGAALSKNAYWWFLPPGILIALVGGALSLINFSIDEVINPKLRAAPDAAKRVRKFGKRAADAAHDADATKIEPEMVDA